jgi:phosphotransferase system IIB component
MKKGILQCYECKKWINFSIQGMCQKCTRKSIKDKQKGINMNKLDKELLEILISNNGTFDVVISQIKQSILKAIMEKAPKKYKGVDEEDCLVMGCEICPNKRNINRVIEEFESVIKEVLGEQKKVKGVFMPHNPNNY